MFRIHIGFSSDPDTVGSMRIPIWFRIQGLDYKYFKKLHKILYQKLQFTYPKASVKNVQATGEAFSPQKITSSTSKHEISSLFLFLWAIFAFHNPDLAGQNQCGSIRIRIRNTEKTIIFLTRVQFTDFYLEDSHPNCWQHRGVHSSCSAPATVK